MDYRVLDCICSIYGYQIKDKYLKKKKQKCNRTKQKNKSGDRTKESNDSPEIPNKRVTSNILGLSKGG